MSITDTFWSTIHEQRARENPELDGPYVAQAQAERAWQFKRAFYSLRTVDLHADMLEVFDPERGRELRTLVDQKREELMLADLTGADLGPDYWGEFYHLRESAGALVREASRRRP